MLRPTVIEVQPMANYVLILKFDNGEVKRFNVKPYITGEWYGKLNDSAYFTSVKTNGYNIEWADGQDICPDDLYYNSITM